MRRIISVVLIVLLLFVSAGCAAEPKESGSGKLHVIATNFPAFDFARAVAGELADVTMLVRASAESHGFEPTAADLVAISQCDLFVCIGGESESWVGDVLGSAGGDTAVVALGDAVEWLPLFEGEEAGHDHAALDEHVWTSLKNAGLMVDWLAAAIGEVDAANAATYAANAASYKQKLAALDTRYEEAVSVAARTDVVFGGRFPFLYLFNDYALTPVAAVYSCGAAADPSAADVARIVDYIEQNNVSVFFKVEGEQSAAAEIIASETSAECLALDAAHAAGSGESYLSIMEQNLESLERAFEA